MHRGKEVSSDLINNGQKYQKETLQELTPQHVDARDLHCADNSEIYKVEAHTCSLAAGNVPGSLLSSASNTVAYSKDSYNQFVQEAGRDTPNTLKSRYKYLEEEYKKMRLNDAKNNTSVSSSKKFETLTASEKNGGVIKYKPQLKPTLLPIRKLTSNIQNNRSKAEVLSSAEPKTPASKQKTPGSQNSNSKTNMLVSGAQSCGRSDVDFVTLNKKIQQQTPAKTYSQLYNIKKKKVSPQKSGSEPSTNYSKSDTCGSDVDNTLDTSGKSVISQQSCSSTPTNANYSNGDGHNNLSEHNFENATAVCDANIWIQESDAKQTCNKDLLQFSQSDQAHVHLIKDHLRKLSPYSRRHSLPEEYCGTVKSSPFNRENRVVLTDKLFDNHSSGDNHSIVKVWKTVAQYLVVGNE